MRFYGECVCSDMYLDTQRIHTLFSLLIRCTHLTLLRRTHKRTHSLLLTYMRSCSNIPIFVPFFSSFALSLVHTYTRTHFITQTAHTSIERSMCYLGSVR